MTQDDDDDGEDAGTVAEQIEGMESAPTDEDVPYLAGLSDHYNERPEEIVRDGD